MALRGTSWQNVPSINPSRGARYTPGGMASWRSVIPAGSSTRSRGGRGGRGQPNDLERGVAAKAVDRDKGFNPFNAGGRLLTGALEALDVPASYVRSGVKELRDLGDPLEQASFEEFKEQGARHISGQEVLGLEDEGVPGAILGFVADVALDPLTYATGGLSQVGAKAGAPAARKLLSEAGKETLGKAAAEAAERSGMSFADDAARQTFIREQGEIAAGQAAQKAMKFRSNQALSPLEREVIGSTRGTYLKIPGQKRLKLDKVIERLAPGRVVEGRAGRKVFKASKRELGLGKAAGRTRAALTQNKYADHIAEAFVKFPDIRKKMLYGTPDEAAHALIGMDKRSRGDLARRLKEDQWGTELRDLQKRSRKAHVNGEDLRYAMAEHMGGEVAGPSLSRMIAQSAERDPTLVDDWKNFFPKLAEDANSIDPENPWLRVIEDYTVNRPSDEAIAFRGDWGSGGGALKKDIFDARQKYGIGEGRIDEVLGEKLVDPSLAGGRSVRQQIDDIVAEKGYPNWFEKDAYKAFPEHVAHMARRYGDEVLAKGLRDAGVAEPSVLAAMGIENVTFPKHKSTLQKVIIRSQVRAERKEAAAQIARAQEQRLSDAVAKAQGMKVIAERGKTQALREQRVLQSQADLLKPNVVREYESGLREQAAVLGTRRQALLDQIDIADEQVFLFDHAMVEQSHRIKLETYAAHKTVTRLEKKLDKGYTELGHLYERMRLLERGEGEMALPAQVLKEVKQNEKRIIQLTGEIEKGERVLHQFEDLAAMPTDQLDQQLSRVDQKLAELVPQYDALPDQNLANKIASLSNTKASILHEKGVIERAQQRVADLDRTGPALMAEFDDLHRAEAMGDDMIHTMFPDLPPEVNGMQVRSYFSTQMGDIYENIEKTRGEVMSAFDNRATMQSELVSIRTQRREAQRNLKKVTKDISLKDRALWAEQDELLRQADEAATRALEIDKAQEEIMGPLGMSTARIQSAEWVEATAERYAASMKAKQLRYEAEALALEETAAGKRTLANTWEKLGKKGFSDEQMNATMTALKTQFKEIGAVSVTQDDWLVEGLQAATVMMGPGFFRPVLKGYDKVLNLWKGYALATPGTVLRNLFGGVFNNGLAQQSILAEDYAKVMSHMFGKGIKNADDAAIMREIENAGLLAGGGTSLEFERKAAHGLSASPISQDFALLRGGRWSQQRVEGLVRGTLAYRVMKNGGTMDDAIADVMKFHFDYDDLNKFERSVLRRMVPFYTWTRKNFPLMLEQIVQNPAYFSRFTQAKNEVEQLSPEEMMIPSYFTENMAARMPFSLGGAQAYMLPDLPFTSLNDVTDPSVAFSQMTPIIKTPVEYAFGKQVFKGIPLKDEYQPVPSFMQGIPGLFPALDAVGLAERGANGDWYMKQKDMYVAEQMLPTYGKARRLFPANDQYSERVLSNWLSFAFGAGIRANTATDIRNEAGSRVAAELEDISSLKELGYVTEDDKQPRVGQTFRAAYEQLGVEE